MIYLLAIFLPPLALLLVGKWFQAILNLILYLVAIALVVTIIFAWGGFIMWVVAVAHAVLAINNHQADKRTQTLIDALQKEKTP